MLRNVGKGSERHDAGLVWRKLKRKTAHHLLAEYPHLKKQFLGRHLWARGYFCRSSGNVTDEIIAKYIAEQNIDQDEEFRVDG